MSKNRYGVPYQGSKNKIAEQIINILPNAENLYDVFAGGCAVTHCALLNNKYKHYYINDIQDSPKLFLDAINGKYHNETRWISHKYFYEHKNDDLYIKYCWSFSNKGDTYMYGVETAEYKKAAHYAIIFDDWTYLKDLIGDVDEVKSLLKDISDISERRKTFCRYFKKTDLKNFNLINSLERLSSLQSLQSLERLQRLQSLQSLDNKSSIILSKGSYEDIQIKENSIIYCDPPYINTLKYAGVKIFNHNKFYDWCEQQTLPVFISEYYMPEDRFTCIWQTVVVRKCNDVKVQHCEEKLYIPNKWVDWYNNNNKNTL